MSAAPHDPADSARQLGYQRPGFAGRYDANRPRPPLAIVDLLLQIAQIPHPDLVVDLGSGTGLSTQIWAGRARRIIGIEPIDEMRRLAETHGVDGIEFRPGVAQQTGLPDASADVVTCAQAFHHMEPESVLAEVGRILRPGGVFATYDYDLPPVIQWEAERAFVAFMGRVRELRTQHAVENTARVWDKRKHLEQLQRSAVFRYMRELVLHHREPCGAERWVGFALSLRDVLPVLELGLTDAELGLDEFRRVSERALGAGGLSWHVSYRLRIGLK